MALDEKIQLSTTETLFSIAIHMPVTKNRSFQTETLRSIDVT